MSDTEALGVLLSKIVVDLTDMKKSLSEGRAEMQGFKTMAQGVGESVKKALAFAGIAIGIYEIASALKEFAKDAASVGARTETLQIAADKIGQTYGMSAASIKYYVEQTKSAGITTQESLQAVSKFLTSGLPLEQLKDLATRARDIAVIAGVNTSEALSRMIQGIITGEQETLRRLMIQVGHQDEIYGRYAQSLGKTKEELNSVEKSQAMLNEVMRLSAGFAGVAAEADKSVGKQLASMARFAEEAKDALWALFGPVMQEGVQQLTGGWKSLQAWAEANQVTLRTWGEAVAEFINHKVKWIRLIAEWVNQSREMILQLTKLLIIYQISKWVVALTASLSAAIGVLKIATPLVAGLQAACAGPFAIVITVAITGLIYGINKIRQLHQELDDLQKARVPKLGGPDKPFEIPKAGEVGISSGGVTTNTESIFGIPISSITKFQRPGEISPELLKKLEIEQDGGKAKVEAQGAQDKAIADAPKPASKDKKSGKAAAATGATEDLLDAYQKMMEQIRQADLQAAQNSLDLLKATNDKKRAELEKSLAEGLIDGQNYYQSLQDLQQQETAAALDLIAQKRRAQEQAYQAVLEKIAGTEMSPEMRAYQEYQAGQAHKMVLSQLDTEAAKAKLDAEKKVTDELKRQVDLRKQYADTTEAMNIDTDQLLGAISQQEATLMKLNLEWKQNREAALKAGLPADNPYFQALDKNKEAKKADTLYGGYATQITQGISSLADALMQGGQELKQVANGVFKGLFTEALKPGLDQLKDLLTSGFKNLFGEAGGAIGSAVMGAIGLIGMLLTSSSSKSSFSASGVTSGVTAHEAMRGIIAGESSLPIAQISESLSEALYPTNNILLNIRDLLAGSRGGGATVNVAASGLAGTVRQAIRDEMERYFQDVYLTT